MVKAELWDPISQPLIAGVKKALSFELWGLGSIEKKIGVKIWRGAKKGLSATHPFCFLPRLRNSEAYTLIFLDPMVD